MQILLIPIVLSLSQFFTQHFPEIFWYPYWYLGNPFNYLIGPIVPLLFLILKPLTVSLFQMYIAIIVLSFLTGGVGIYFLVRDFKVGKRQSFLAGILYIILPAGILALHWQNGLQHIAFAILPYILILGRKFLRIKNLFVSLLLSFSIAFALLIDISILLPLIVGTVALFISFEEKIKIKEKAIEIVLVFLLALSLSTIWYTPKFWWVIAVNPSFGGVPLVNLIWNIFQSLFQLLPVVLAVILIKWRKYKPERDLLFGLIFFASFLFLSIVRFLANPAFVMDWTGFVLEIQFGVAILAGAIITNLFKKNSKSQIVVIAVLVLISLTTASIVIDVIKGQPKTFSDYQKRIIAMLKTHVKQDERVFFSGSSVFWVDSLVAISQVRGGADEVSLQPFWAEGSYQIREGESARLSQEWLKAFGVSYVLVNDKKSTEPFSDFKYSKKFSKFQLLAFDKGDTLYKVQGITIGRVAQAKILEIPQPINGADQNNLHEYVSTFKRPIFLAFPKPDTMIIQGKTFRSEVISLAVTYDSLWRIESGQGIIQSDSLGNMVIIPAKIGEQDFKLTYKANDTDFLAPFLVSVLLVFSIVNYDKVFPWFDKKLSKLSFDLSGEDY